MTPCRSQREPLVASGEIEHHVADLTVTASADVKLAALQEELARQDQWLPIDGDPSLPLGRLIEVNSTGPLRLGFGAWRDLLLGMQFTLHSGELITVGGRTMKNVAGYDLTKFMVGQRGIFGKIVTITTRTYKSPQAALLAKFESSDHFINRLMPTSSRPQWAMLADGFLFCGYLGNEKTIAFHQSELELYRPIELRRQSLPQDIEFRSKHWRCDGFRASVPPTRILDFVRHAQLREWAADAAFGIIVGPCPADRRQAIRQAAGEVGGSAWLTDEQDFGVAGSLRELLERIKSAFKA